MAFVGWWSDQRQEASGYLIEENRILRAQLSRRRLLSSAIIKAAATTTLRGQAASGAR